MAEIIKNIPDSTPNNEAASKLQKPKNVVKKLFYDLFRFQ